MTTALFPHNGLSLEAWSAVFAGLKLGGLVENFPAAWRKTPNGKRVYRVLAEAGFPNWGACDKAIQQRARLLFALMQKPAEESSDLGQLEVPAVSTGSALPAGIQVLQRAWLGDAMHALDVRCALVIQRPSGGITPGEYSGYTSNIAQAGYYLSVSEDKAGLMQLSAHSLGTRFELSYLDPAFRTNYLKTVFPEQEARVLAFTQFHV